jgi:hypothetical protein
MNKTRRFSLSPVTGAPVYGLGILTDEPGYRLCWLLNQAFNWNLAKTDDIVASIKESPISQNFPCYEGGPGQGPAIRIVGNRSAEGQWLTIFRQVDFLLVITGTGNNRDTLEELKTLLTSKIPQIRGLFKVPLPSFCYL